LIIFNHVSDETSLRPVTSYVAWMRWLFHKSARWRAVNGRQAVKDAPVGV
jgi:hypothetical protein